MAYQRHPAPLFSLALLVLCVSGCRSHNRQPSETSLQPAQPQSQPQPQSQSGPAAPATGSEPAGQPSQPPSPVQPGVTQPASGQQGAPAPGSAGPASTPPAPAEPVPPAVAYLPAGTRLNIRLDADVGSRISRSGERFSATVAEPLVRNGRVVIPRGARASGTVVDAKPLGRFQGGAELALRLDRVRTNYGFYAVTTSALENTEKGKGGRSAGFIGGGGGLGAIVGGLAGGGKGAALGALAGAGAGAAGSAFTGNKEIVLPAETELTFRLERSVHISQGEQADDGERPGLSHRDREPLIEPNR